MRFGSLTLFNKNGHILPMLHSNIFSKWLIFAFFPKKIQKKYFFQKCSKFPTRWYVTHENPISSSKVIHTLLISYEIHINAFFQKKMGTSFRKNPDTAWHGMMTTRHDTQKYGMTRKNMAWHGTWSHDMAWHEATLFT